MEKPAASREVLRLSILFASLYFIQGIAEPTEGMVAQPVRSMMDDWGVSQATIGTVMGLIGLPWMFKLLYGLLTDFVPIRGSRRRSYLLICSAITILSLLALFLFPPRPGNTHAILIYLLIASVGIAFTDVVVDALMVEKGQRYGMTGRFQSIQWTAIYLAPALTGSLSGYLSASGRQSFGFLICALATIPTFFLAWFLVKEDPRPEIPGSWRGELKLVLRVFKTPAMWASSAFLLLLNFNPFSSAVLDHHMTKTMGLSEQFYGNCVSVAAVGCMVGSVAYGFYCRRLSINLLLHLGIASCVLATVAYWALRGPTSALIISFFAGLALITTTLTQLDVAARTCPPAVAGTMFALLMAISNLGINLSQVAGGHLTEWFNRGLSPTGTFNVLVGIGGACTAACWFLVPWLKRHPPAEAAELTVKAETKA